MRAVLVERYSRLSRVEELLHKLLGGVAVSYGCGSAADRTKHMDIVNFGRGCCEIVRWYMDSYISNELLIESNHEILRHVEECSECLRELEIRLRIRASLQSAVRQEPVPTGLTVGEFSKEQRGCKSLRFKQTEFTTELSFEPLTEVR